MTEARDLRMSDSRSVIDAGVAICVKQQMIVPARERRKDADIGLVTCRKHHCVLAAIEIREPTLKLIVTVIASVRDARSGSSRAKVLDRFDRLLDYCGVVGKAELLVGAEQQYQPVSNFRFRC